MEARSEATTALLSHEMDKGFSLSADLNSGCLMTCEFVWTAFLSVEISARNPIGQTNPSSSGIEPGVNSANHWAPVLPYRSMCTRGLIITVLDVNTGHNTAPRVLCRICPTRVKEPLKHPRYKSVIDGLITGADHLWLESCIVGQTENPLIKIPSTHGEALKSNCVLEIFELQSQVESIILLRMGEWIYNTLRRPKTAEVIHKKRVPSPHTTSVGTFSEHHIPPLQLVAS